jgi:hypothetical protein
MVSSQHGVRVKRSIRLVAWLLVSIPFVSAGCAPANGGTPGSPAVQENLPITGTIYTIVFENHGVDAVFSPGDTYLNQLRAEYGSAAAYLTNVHPSLPNYIVMTSAGTGGIGDDGPPRAHAIDGSDHLADQLEAGGISWRAYMEGMGEPCGLEDVGTYRVKHDPFAYYTSITSDPERCSEHIVDFDQEFATDLESNRYQFMWITPDICDDMHDCPPSASDAWLARVIPEIMASRGYQEGGAIFLLWDEGDADATYAWSLAFGRAQNIPAIVISDHLVSPGFESDTTYGHDSYLATIEDAFGLPRLPSTEGSTPMADFFVADPSAPSP